MIDLKATLKPGDLFVSYWLADRLMIAFGDHQEIQETEIMSAGGIVPLVRAFAQQVTRIEHFGNFINPEIRPAHWPAPVAPDPPPQKLLEELRALLIPAKLSETCRKGAFRRLVVFPDGLLHSLPIHLLLGNDQPQGVFPDGVVYAPSASAYAYCCQKRQTDAPKQAIVVVGDKNDIQLLWEAERISEDIPCATEIVTSLADFQKLAPASDIIYVATHGNSPESSATAGATPSSSEDTEWQLLLDQDRIVPRDFFREQIKLKRGSVVILSACSVGNLMPGEAHELLGLVRSLFYAGAATVLAARWPILGATAVTVFANTIKSVFEKNNTFASGMNRAIIDASGRDDFRKLMAGPEASTFFWGGFAVFGCGD